MRDCVLLRYMKAYIEKYKREIDRNEEARDEEITPEDEDDTKRIALETAAIMWQRLEEHYFGVEKVSKITTIINDIGKRYMGLLGPGNGCVTYVAEKMFGRTVTFRLHSLAHDVSGRFWKHHKLGPGYLYSFRYNEGECGCKTYLRGCNFSGHISGLLNTFRHRDELNSVDCFHLISIEV